MLHSEFDHTPISSINGKLYHHNVLGMKWGIRKEREISGRQRSAAPVKKSKHRTKLETRYQSKGMTQEEAEKAATTRIRVEKAIAVAGTVALAAYGGYKVVEWANTSDKALDILTQVAEAKYPEEAEESLNAIKKFGITNMSELPKTNGASTMLDDLAKVNPNFKKGVQY